MDKFKFRILNVSQEGEDLFRLLLDGQCDFEFLTKEKYNRSSMKISGYVKNLMSTVVGDLVDKDIEIIKLEDSSWPYDIIMPRGLSLIIQSFLWEGHSYETQVTHFVDG